MFQFNLMNTGQDRTFFNDYFKDAQYRSERLRAHKQNKPIYLDFDFLRINQNYLEKVLIKIPERRTF